MSGYGKPQEAYLYEYAATRPVQGQSYSVYAQPPFALPYPTTQAQISHGLPPGHTTPFLVNPNAEARDIGFHGSPSTFIDARPRHLPQVIGHSPLRGTHGAKIYVHISTDYDLTAQRPLYFNIMFGSKRCGGALTKLNPNGQNFTYAVAADIPPFSSTEWLESQVPLCLSMEDEDGQPLGVVEVGDFTYADGAGYEPFTSAADISRKRKISAESTEYIRPPSKKGSSQQLQERNTERSVVHGTPSLMLQAPPYGQASAPYGYSTAGYDRSLTQPQAYTRRTHQLPYLYPTTSSESAKTVGSQSPVTPGYSPYSSVSQISRSPALVAAPTPSREELSPEVTPATTASQPALIRTSTLQPSPIAATASSSQPFNPYAMYPNSKAVLKIEDDLESMVEDWTRDELSARRRLVQFRRRQSGSTITTTFGPVSPQERAPNSICVSCIWWMERNEHYITSVDTIYLLESLVAVRFTVEEKNRIRRNLEGFRPLTVSKTKSEYESFFKVIMGFPNPKPRNIEKDVKVFPWKILAHALKKIISKYSASYSSTAGALPITPAGPSESGTEYHYSSSSRSASSPERSVVYASRIPSTDDSLDLAGSAGPARSAGPPDLRISVPELVSEPSTSTWHRQSAYHHTQNLPTYSTGLSATGRASWDFAAYMEPDPTTTASSNAAQGARYPREGLSSVPGQLPEEGAFDQRGRQISQSKQL